MIVFITQSPSGDNVTWFQIT